MPAVRKLTTKLVKMREVCERLAICRRSFATHWHSVFTDVRPEADRRKGCERKVLEDELATAVESGAAAVLTFRRVMGRV